MLKNTNGFKLFFIDTNIETRYERLIQRSENIDDRNKSFEEFKKQELAETGVYINQFKEIADYIIDNNEGVDKLHEHTVTQEAYYDEEGNVTWEAVERDYYWLFCLREDGKSLKHDTGSRWVFNEYKVGQKIVIRLRVGASGTEYFRGIHMYEGAEAQ
jgi:hypothetical protein